MTIHIITWDGFEYDREATEEEIKELINNETKVLNFNTINYDTSI